MSELFSWLLKGLCHKVTPSAVLESDNSTPIQMVKIDMNEL